MAADANKLDLSKIRNLGIIAHIDAGKTTTTEHLLYYAGATHRSAPSTPATPTTDCDAEEQERGITIYSACIPFTWRDCTINLIDTPGHVDFTAEVERSLRVLDGCVVVFDAQKGVEAQSETVWRQADKYQVPRLVFINKMDVVGANFDNALDEVRERLEGNPGAAHRPHRQRLAQGQPDAVPRHHRPDRDEGPLLRRRPTRARPSASSRSRRTSRTTAQALARTALRRADRPRRPGPHHQRLPRRQGDPGRDDPRGDPRADAEAASSSRCCAAPGREHIGIQPLLDAVTWYLPSPLDRPPVVGVNPKKKDKEEKRKPDPKEPFCGLVFKIVADTHGELFYRPHLLRHAASRKSRPYNPGRNVKELVSKIYHTHADPKDRQELPEATAGDIVAFIGLKDSITGDTLCDFAASDPAGTDHSSPRRSSAGRSSRSRRPTRTSWRHVLNLLHARRPDVHLAHRPGHRPDADERHGHAAPGNQAAPHGARLPASRCASASRASAIARRCKKAVRVEGECVRRPGRRGCSPR